MKFEKLSLFILGLLVAMGNGDFFSRSERSLLANDGRGYVPPGQGPTTARTSTTAIPTPVTPDPPTPSEPEDQVALMLHNGYRITHGVPLLKFTSQLKELAEQCADYHANKGTNTSLVTPTCPLIPTDRTPVAESVIAMDVTPLKSPSQRFREAISKGWYSNETASGLDYGNPKYKSAYRHLVQIIWKSTTEVGCANSGGQSTGGKVYVSCLYSPPGNIQTVQAFADNVFRDKF